MKLLIIDNYDSFVYNIAQLLGQLNVTSDVIRNDKITLDEIEKRNYDAIVISPGPGTPEDERGFTFPSPGPGQPSGRARAGEILQSEWNGVKPHP